MKKIILKFKNIVTGVLIGTVITITFTSCRDNLLDQQPTVDPGEDTFWKTENDGLTALMGAYSAVRALFDRDYFFDGHGEFVRNRSVNTLGSTSTLLGGAAYNPAGSFTNPSNYGSGFDYMFRFLYGGVNRVNYVIDGIESKLIPNITSEASRTNAEIMVAEARLLRGMLYFKLISMWGDVPYFSNVINDNSEVQDIPRTPIAEIRKYILDDFDYAVATLPNVAQSFGRAAKPAALSFRGKLNLYWACWNNFGWPELTALHPTGDAKQFAPSQTEAKAAYQAAANDFRRVIDDFGLELFEGGAPGEIDELGKADKLPNYYYLFLPTANGNSEAIMVFTHGGTSSGQGESLMRDFGGRSHENSQNRITPRFELANRYQSTITGDFCDPLIPSTNRNLLNSAINPQSYANRDYRMKSTIMWDYEMSKRLVSLKDDGWMPYIYGSWGIPVTIDGVVYISYTHDSVLSGYVFRKFIRNYAGQGRVDGDFAWPVMRLADVYLMYAEASNELNNGPEPYAVKLINKVRHRAGLPDLLNKYQTNKSTFFDAIEQERIVELVGEGHRGFDLRRWRAIERAWCPPYGNGVQTVDTRGVNRDLYFRNQPQLTYDRCYIFRIPPSERERNPNLSQNIPWL